jgi:DNA modification methylase
MKPYTLHHGDCLDVLKTFADCSVDAVVTDPPYGLSFMGKRWDYDVPSEDIWRECLRVLKPGGHLLAFAGTRTQHRMAVRIEDAGFEIRDMIAWVYGSGFPKSLDISKAIDKAGGGESAHVQARRSLACEIREKREAAGVSRSQLAEWFPQYTAVTANWERTDAGFRIPSEDAYSELVRRLDIADNWRELVRAEDLRRLVSEGGQDRRDDGTVIGLGHSGREWESATEAAKQWQGWGTALKPAVEPVGIYHKGLTLENVFGILMASLTQELWRSICQWSNASASDAENLLSGIRARLEKAEAFSVVEGARTFALENIESAILAASSSISPRLTETARDTTRGGSVQEGANPSGRKLDMQGTGTQAGRVDVMSLVDMFICATTEHTGQNIASLWSGILGETLNQANTFTIATALRLTTALKTLKCLMQANTLQSTGSLESCSPALEPITLARKPPIGTVAANVLEHGTGGLNIDGCRVEANGDKLGGGHSSAGQQMSGGWERPWMKNSKAVAENAKRSKQAVAKAEQLGRWPANFIHDGSEEVVALFPDSKGSGSARTLNRGQRDDGWGMSDEPGVLRDAGSGSAARFFYCAKASKKDRDEGLDAFNSKASSSMSGRRNPENAEWDTGNDVTSRFVTNRKNVHPTVKPTDLMRYLCRLVTPPNGLVLDPFTGSGSTGKAAILEGFRFVGIEREAEYIELARARIEEAIRKSLASLQKSLFD